MKTVIQRVTQASVTVDGVITGSIGVGALLLVGVEAGDTQADADATADKIAKMRFFPGETPMDKTLTDMSASCLVVSQFTLAAHIKKGNRPSFTRALHPELAEPLYLRVVERLQSAGITIATGTFGAHMDVALVNDGPVTLLIETRSGKIL
jgi:D-tyrosyl-tRNA(Tyr) deacylase